jgi:hypothetical protein
MIPAYAISWWSLLVKEVVTSLNRQRQVAEHCAIRDSNPSWRKPFVLLSHERCGVYTHTRFSGPMHRAQRVRTVTEFPEHLGEWQSEMQNPRTAEHSPLCSPPPGR